MPDIKVQLVMGQEAHTDQRGAPAGIGEGDHHRTLKEQRIEDPAAVEAIIAAAELANQKAVEAGKELFATLESQGFLDEVLVGAGALMGEDVSDAKFGTILLRVYDND